MPVPLWALVLSARLHPAADSSATSAASAIPVMLCLISYSNSGSVKKTATFMPQAEPFKGTAIADNAIVLPGQSGTREDVSINSGRFGTHVGTSADAPYLDCVYKLQEYAGRARRLAQRVVVEKDGVVPPM
ncbi:hypothetical protein AB4Y40_26940 [Paraburkholderia sp. EG287B]|uniref:hypothetical protein n=1 Tax=unclassified Paraburkholderia TaxID=2615204 RepID=UPI0034D350EF